jgi:hypothetical protein
MTGREHIRFLSLYQHRSSCAVFARNFNTDPRHNRCFTAGLLCDKRIFTRLLGLLLAVRRWNNTHDDVDAGDCGRAFEGRAFPRGNRGTQLYRYGVLLGVQSRRDPCAYRQLRKPLVPLVLNDYKRHPCRADQCLDDAGAKASLRDEPSCYPSARVGGQRRCGTLQLRVLTTSRRKRRPGRLRC